MKERIRGISRGLLGIMAAALLVTSLPSRLASADVTGGQNDTGFDPGTGVTGATATVKSLATHIDGKIYLVGDFTSFNGTSRPRIARVNIDGTHDTVFNPGFGANSEIRDVALEPDGRPYVVGTFTAVNNTPRNRVARLALNGTLEGFDPNVSGDVNAIIRQPDGKILLGGDFQFVNGLVSRNRIARFSSSNVNNNDTSFNPGSGADAAIYAMGLQSDNKIVIGGAFTTISGTTQSAVARLNTDGSLDGAFATGAFVTGGAVRSLAIQSDGKIVIVGDFTQVHGVARGGIARLNTDGTLDTGFMNSLAGAAGGNVQKVTLQADGRMIVGGAFTSINGTSINRIARLKADGALDTGYGAGLSGASGTVYALNVQYDGRMIVGGAFSTMQGVSRNGIARLGYDGTNDSPFLNGITGPDARVRVISVQPDGKIVIAGEFTTYDGVSRNGIARLNADSTLDPSFLNAMSGITGGPVSAVAIQSDGKIVVGGNFSTVNGTARTRIARLNADGSLDTGFQNGLAGANGEVKAMVVQSDGKIVIAGDFGQVNSTTRSRIARLNVDGTLDTSYLNAGADGANASVLTMVIQSDDKVILAGDFTLFNTANINKIARLNTNGSLDSGFMTGLAGVIGSVKALALQPDGRIVLAGNFSNVNSSPRTNLARLSITGTLDTTFAPGLNGQVNAVVVQSDGRIIVGGEFTMSATTSRPRIARFNSAGLIENGGPNTLPFQNYANNGIDNTVSALALYPWPGMVIVGGDFSLVNNVGRTRLARLNTMTYPVFATGAVPPTSAQIGVPFSYTYNPGGYLAPTFYQNAGTYPPGLSLDTETGVLSGLPTTFGTYSGLQVTAYNGAGANGVSPVHSIVITKANSQINITSALPDPSVTGQSVTVNFAVTAASAGAVFTPTGTVTVTAAGASCVTTVAVGSCALSPAIAGAGTITATYEGDSNFKSSTGTTAHIVNKANTTTAITGDTPDPSTVGQTVTVNYSVAVSAPGGGTPTGTVTVTDGVNLCTGTVAAGSCDISLTTAGTRNLTASYGGSSNYNGSASAVASHVVNKGNSSLALSSSGTVVGQSVQVNATASPASGNGIPTGTVTVTEGIASCTITLSGGTGSCTLPSYSTPGSRSIAGSYGGDSNYIGSSATPLNHVVSKAGSTTTITSDTPDPSVAGQTVAVAFSVAVNAPGAGSPSGTVTVSDGATQCSASVATGTCNLTFATAGVKQLTATYAGDSNINGSTSVNAEHVVNKGDTTTTITSDTPDPSVAGQAVTVNFTVVANSPASGTPTGNVTVTDGNVQCTASVATGSCSITLMTAGARSLTASYAGDSNFNGSASSASSHQVNKASTSIAITSDTPDPSVVGQSVTVNFAVNISSPGAGTPDGTVTVTDGTVSCNAPASAGSCNLTFTSAGAKNLVASFGGNANFDASNSAPASHTVNKAATSLSISSTTTKIGQAVVVNFALSVSAPGAGSPTGNVTISDGTNQCTAALSAGSCTLPAYATIGNRQLTGAYAGDANFEASTSSAITHSVTDEPVGGLTINGDGAPVTVEAGSTTTFTATTSAGSNTQFTWDFGDGPAVRQMNVSPTLSPAGAETATSVTSYVFQKPGEYTVKVTATNAAGSQSATIKVIVTAGSTGGKVIFIPSVMAQTKDAFSDSGNQPAVRVR